MPLTAGATLGPYEILARTGAGGMGEVYKARDTRLHRTVAIKVLPAALTADPDARQRLDREAKAVAALSHPHICSLFDIGHQDGTDFLVMEFLEGETLAQRLTRGKLPLDEALRTGIQIADALGTAHKAGIIHRDLKPGNVMLTKRGATLLDFGLAKPPPVALSAGMTQVATEQPLTGVGTLLGTLQYMAPEQLQGLPADARTDVFAFGCVLYEMVTGRRASTHGGSQPRWRGDGRELFYLALDGTMMSVCTADPASPDPPRTLFRLRLVVKPVYDQYAVTADGQRFLVIDPAGQPITRLTVLTNWPAALKPR